MKTNRDSKLILFFVWVILITGLLTACRESVPIAATIVRGYIRNEQGKPVEGVTVVISASNQRFFQSGGFKDFCEGASNADGYYQVSCVLEKGYLNALSGLRSYNSQLYSSYIGYQKGSSGLVPNDNLSPGKTNEIDWVLTLR